MSPNPNDTLTAAQLEKLSLEIESLKGNWVTRYTPLITVLITVAGFCFGVYQFRLQQNEKLQALRNELKRDEDAVRREFSKPLWEKQLQLYFDASAAAATISRTKDPVTRKRAEETFWQLYQGPLAVIETKEVAGAMANFGHCLDGTRECSDVELGNLSLALASTIQESLSKSWNVMVGDLPKDKVDYRRQP